MSKVVVTKYEVIKGTVCQYGSHATAHYFTACEIITKYNFTRIYKIDNKQWWKDHTKWDLVMLVSIVKTGKVLTNEFTFPMKPLLNGGYLEKSRVYPAMILWHVICPRFTWITNHFVCPISRKILLGSLRNSITNHYRQPCYIYLREALLLCTKIRHHILFVMM